MMVAGTALVADPDLIADLVKQIKRVGFFKKIGYLDFFIERGSEVDGLQDKDHESQPHIACRCHRVGLERLP